MTLRRFRKIRTQPLRSKNPYSFQLSWEKPGDKRETRGDRWRKWETNEGRQGGSGSQEQPGMEIISLGQGGSGSQEQPRMEIMKGDKLGRQDGSGS